MDSKSRVYQTLQNAEERHLIAMSSNVSNTSASSSSTSTTTTTTTKKVKKVSKKALIKTEINQSIEQIEYQQQQLQQQQQHIAEECSENLIKQEQQLKRKLVKKQQSSATENTTAVAAEAAAAAITTTTTTNSEFSNKATEKTTLELNANKDTSKMESKQQQQQQQPEVLNGKKKLKSKKNKKNETDNQNISVKSSFSKFDALQKRNLIHVRSSDAGKAQEKFSNPQGEKETNCRLCTKAVFKMEEIKAEKSIFHKNCFRCHECNKQLKLDNYQSHEGILYCMVHFKLLFAPKCVEDTEPEKPRKHELIIRENQPTELPPDVVRASDKPDLGLEELQQLNVRSRFQVFENGVQPSQQQHKTEDTAVRRSTSILSKLAKLQALGFNTNLSDKDIAAHAAADNSDASDADTDAKDSAESDDDHDHDYDDDDDDIALVRKRTQRERPIGLVGNAMSDIKNKFEKGPMMSKEERREERKQEIQNIRSRLFMGKQARIKEMYQQAVADSEQAITAASKKPELQLDGAARSMKERFENGQIFKEGAEGSDSETHDGAANRSGGIHDEADVFESAISKKSRCIFMELDANVAAGKNQPNTKAATTNPAKKLQAHRLQMHENEQENNVQFNNAAVAAVVKYDEKPEDIKIETSEISSKFKFFETYRPTECEKKTFRITPPREGVVKLPTPETDNENIENTTNAKIINDRYNVEKSQTTSKMLNKFREMEQNKRHENAGPKPLKCFTPPPDGGRRVYQEQDSDVEGSQDDDDEDEDDEDDENEDEHFGEHRSILHTDEALKEAQAAARAKELRAKFEKWEANERNRELNDERIDIYSDQVSDNTNIESTKTIRERFENMKNSNAKSPPQRQRHEVNRFV